MSKEFSELKRRLDGLMKLHARVVICFIAVETILKLSAPNVIGDQEARRNLAAVNRYKGFFNTALDAYNYELLMTLARIFVAHRDALYLEKLVNYAEQNRKKLTAADFKEYHEDNAYLSELAASYEGLNNADLLEIRDGLKRLEGVIERLKSMRDETLAHVNLQPVAEARLTPQEMADLIELSEKILNTLSSKHFHSISYFTVLEDEVKSDIQSLIAVARYESENRAAIGKLMDDSLQTSTEY